METLTKERILRESSHDEVFGLVHEFIWTLNESRSEGDRVGVLDRELSETIETMVARLR